MTMPPSGLKKIGSFNKEELRIFLQSNNIKACSTMVEREAINGKTFLTLSKTDFSKWKKHVGDTEVKEFKNFLKNVKSKPDEFILKGYISNPSSSTPGTPTIPSKRLYQTKKEQSVTLTIKHINVIKTDDNVKKNQELVKVPSGELIQPQKPILPPVLPKRCLPLNTKKEIKTEIQHPQTIYESKYYLKIDRQEAETLLRTSTRDGAYLFRPSTKHHCAFSVYFENDVRHFGINLVEGKLKFVTVGNDIRFNSLEEIVYYFNIHPELQTANTRQTIILSNHVYDG